MKYLKIFWNILLAAAYTYVFIVNAKTVRSVNNELKFMGQLLSFETFYYCKNFNKKEEK